MWPGCRSAAAIAASASPAASTVYPARSSARRPTSRTCGSSSTRRTVSLPSVHGRSDSPAFSAAPCEPGDVEREGRCPRRVRSRTATWPPLCRAMPAIDDRSTSGPGRSAGRRIEHPRERLRVQVGPGVVHLEGDVRARPESRAGSPRAPRPPGLGRCGGGACRLPASRRGRARRAGGGPAPAGRDRPAPAPGRPRARGSPRPPVPTTWRIALIVPETSWFRSRDRGASCGRRLKARRWRERVAARSAACRIWARSSRASGARELSSRSRATWPRMPVSRLLKSCAMPPASWAISAVRPSSASRCSSARRSVTSVVHPL